jgi:hypothetical protein
MIFPIPPIYNFSWAAKAIWELEQTTDVKLEPSCDPNEPSPVLSESVEEQWVFKGYQYRLEATWYPWVNPGWDHFVDNDPDEMRERELRYEQERHALQAKPSPQAEAAMRADSVAQALGAKAPDVSDLDERFGPPPIDPLGGRADR